MKIVTFIFNCCVLLAASMVFLGGRSAYAYSGGITGLYQVGCGGCHGAQSANTSVTLSGSTTLSSLIAAEFSVIVANTNQSHAGTNIAVRNATGNVGTLEAVTGLQIMNGELTHNGKQKLDGNGRYSFAFKWTPPSHGTYTLYAAGNAVNDNGNNSGDSWNLLNATTITVRGATATVQGNTFCAGQSAVVNWTQTGYTTFRIEVSSNDGATWTEVAGSINATANTYTWNIPTEQVGGATYRLRLVDAGSGLPVAQTGVFSISPATQIMQHPVSLEVCEARSFTLTVQTNQQGATYQWRRNGNLIPGATASGYTVNLASFVHDGVYDVVVKGCTEVTSNTCIVKVNFKPLITKEPDTIKVACSGSSLTLSIEASGTDLAYQWSKNGVALTGRTSATLAIDNAQPSDAGEYKCVVSGTCPLPVESRRTMVTINEAPSITTHPTSKVVKPGATVLLTVEAVGADLTYQWMKNGSSISGATASTLTIDNVREADAASYNVEVKNSCGASLSRTAQLSVSSAQEGILIVGEQDVSLNIAPCPIPLIDVTELKNAGTGPVIIKSIDVNVSGWEFTLEGLSLPITLEAGEDVKLTLRSGMQGTAPVEGAVTITWSTPTGVSQEAAIRLTVQPRSALEHVAEIVIKDSLTTQTCMNVMPWCPSITVSKISLEGPDAGYFNVVGLDLPLTLTEGEDVSICLGVEPGTTILSATMIVEHSAGESRIRLRRDISTSVAEAKQPTVLVYPNPAMDYLNIAGPGKIDFSVLTIDGRLVHRGSLEGAGQWDLTSHGFRVPRGTYLLRLETLRGLPEHTIIMIY